MTPDLPPIDSAASPAPLPPEPPPPPLHPVTHEPVGPDDLGRLIGKGGRVANAIRTIAKAASTGSDRRVLVEFVED